MDFSFLVGSSQIVESLSKTLLHFTWQALLIAALLKLVLYVTPQRNYYQRYSFAVFALFLLCVTPVLTFLTIHESSVLSVSSQQIVNSISGQTGASITLTGLVEPATLNSFSPADWFSSIGLTNADVVLIWLIGVLLALGKFSWDVHNTYRLTTHKVEPVSSEIQSMVDKLIVKMSIRTKVRVLKTTKVAVPVVVGWLKPVILLPVAVAVGLEREQLALILAHELAHIRRLDFLVNLFQGFLQVVFFFHPSVYWINKVIREEREFICDSAALAAIGDDEESRLNLAKALLNTAELKQGNFSLMAVAASGGHLKKRVYRIIASENRRLPSANSIVVLLGALLFSLAAMASSVHLDGTHSGISAETIEGEQFDNLNKYNGIAARVEAQRPKIELAKSSIVQSSSILAAPSKSNLNRDFKAKPLSKTIESNQDNVVEKDYLKPKSEVVISETPESRSIKDKVSAKGLKVTKVETEAKATKTKQQGKPQIRSSEVKKAKAPKEVEKLDLKLAKLDVLDVENDSIKEGRVSTKDAKLANNLIENSEISVAALNEDKKNISDRFINVAMTTQIDSLGLSLEKTANELDIKDNREFPNVAIGFTEPKAIFTPYPRYPAEAFDQKLTGQVKVDFVINKEGKVVDLKFDTNGSRVFVKEIKQRLRRWKYEPAVMNGEKISHTATMYFEFDVPASRPFYIRETGSRIKRLASN